MATYEELMQSAEQIRTNELPESNTHELVGQHLKNQVEHFNKEGNGIKSLIEANKKEVDGKLSELGEKIPNTNFITCSTVNSVANKTVNILDFKLSNRVRLLIKMTNANTADNAYLSISSPQLDTKPLYYNGERASSTNSWEAGAVLDVYYDGTNFQATDFQGGSRTGSGSGGNMILEWNTDVATTRKQVKQADRKDGMQISYKNDDGEWINEQYIGTSVTDTEWAKDANWESIASQTDINDVQTALGLTFKSYSGEYISGFISDKGVVTESSTYKHTEPILLKKGEFIQVSGYCDGAALLSRTDVSGSSYTPIYVAVGATIQTYRYQAKAEEYVCVSWKIEVDIVIGTSSLDEIKGGQEEHDKKIAQIESIIGLEQYNDVKYESGSITYDDGALQSSSNRVRSNNISNAYIVKNTDPNLKFSIRYYKGEKFISGDSDFTEGVAEKKIEVNCDSIRIVVGRVDNASISPTSIFQSVFPVGANMSQEFESIKESILNIEPENSEIVLGSIDSITGHNIQSDTRARCVRSYNSTNGLVISIPLGVKIAFRYYDKDGVFVKSDASWTTNSDGIIKKQWNGMLRFIVSYEGDSKIDDISQLVVLVQRKIYNVQYISDEVQPNLSNKALVLKAILDRNWDDGTIVPQAYLWHDDLYFYLSNSIYADKKILFSHVSYGFNPYQYSMAILRNGDILAIWRTEQKNSGSDDSYRRNPIIFRKSNGYEPLEVDFGDNLKPSAWLQNCGFTHVYKGDFFMFAEYARPSIERACVWKVTGDHTVSDNWKVVLEKELSGHIDIGFKHFHAVQYDPYSGIIYAASGDDDTAAAIYVSKDNGDSFELLHGPNEKDCRLLNFIFTKDKIYWASDSGYEGKHFLFSIERGEDNVMNFSTLTELHEFEHIGGLPGVATYATCYIPLLNCLLFLDRADAIVSSMPLFVYDIATNKVIKVDDISFFSNRYGGFRTECSQLYTTSKSIIVGFGYTQFPSSDNRNNMKLLGNTEDECNIRNIVLRLEKSGDGYRVTYDTVMS